MYRNDGRPAFESDATFAADRKIGQLVRMKPNGKLTTVLGEGNLLFFPTLQSVDVSEEITADQSINIGVQVYGIAKVWVETAASITAGTQVGVGTTGIGIAVAGASGFVLGQALETPAGNGVYIPVLLAPRFIPAV